jgi:hypothetical protein
MVVTNDSCLLIRDRVCHLLPSVGRALNYVNQNSLVACLCVPSVHICCGSPRVEQTEGGWDVNRVVGEKVTGIWRKVHNEELHNLYSLSNIMRVIMSRQMRWFGRVACVRTARNACRISLWVPEGGRPLGRPRGRLGRLIKLIVRKSV